MNPQGIFHSLFEPAIICNLAGEILVANNSFATLYNKTTKWFTRKKPALEMIFPNQHKTLKKLIYQNYKLKDEQATEEIFDLFNENEFYFVAKCTSMGENFLILFQDFSNERRLQTAYKFQVEELKSLNDKILEINHISRAMTSTLGNKIRVPLSRAVLALEKLNTAIKENKTGISVRDVAIQLEEISTISRKLSLMNGETQLEMEKCHVVEFMNDTVRAFRRIHPKYSDYRIELKIDNYFQHADFLTSKDKLQQCLFELFKNAYEENQDSNEANKFILIRVKRPKTYGHHFEVSVLNKGDKMAKHVEKKLFSPFFTTKEGHLGTGLSMVKNLLPQMGGSIHYEKDTLDYNEFVITLPMMNELPRKTSKESTTYFITDSSSQMTLFSLMMEENRLPYVCFDDIKMAIEKLNVKPTDLVVIEYKLKSYNGLHLARHLWQKFKHQPMAILVDAEELSQLLENQKQGESFDILLKPLYVNQIQKLLKKLKGP
jgi:signal transduction histidine kinase/CheY-like chemotaxis protein